MARFQAQTNAVLDAELDSLRERLGLRENQKADLLRELTALASWVLKQAELGRTVHARGDGNSDTEVLRHPVFDQVHGYAPHRIVLNDQEVVRLAEILDRGFSPTPALRQTLKNLADPDRQLPTVTWPAPKE